MKKIGMFWIVSFVGDVTNEVGLRPFWLRLSGPGLQLVDGIFWLNFLLETKIDSKSFEPLIGFLAFLVQNLWDKNNKIIN